MRGLPLLLLLLPSAGQAGVGGPDSFGYTWIDSFEPGGPSYDPNAQPVSASIGLCDDEWYTVNLGFDFYDQAGQLASRTVGLSPRTAPCRSR